ncbi:flippase-like domain-containing protein, partial [Candidatus Dependentiae bacterium]|nr:flippase-like domain-containing protein [Candidatus Dependentiae bacterium]
VGKALTIGLVKWLILMVLFSVISTIVFFSKDLFLVDEKVFQFFKNVIIFVLAIVIIFMLSGFFPFFYKKLISRLIIWICKIKFLRKYRNKMLRTINALIEEFHASFISFTNTNKTYLFLNMIVTILFMICYASVAVFLMAGLGKINILDFNIVWQIMILQIFLIFVIYFSPTPGASGTMEAGFALLFIGIASKSMIGFVVLFWRMFTNFIPVILGGFFILKFFSGKPMVREIKTTIEFEREKIKEEFEKVAEIQHGDSEEK